MSIPHASTGRALAALSLPEEGWVPKHHARLRALLARGGPAAAAFDWDNTCILGDLGDRVTACQLAGGVLAIEPAALAERLAMWPQAVPAALAADVVAAWRPLWPLPKPLAPSPARDDLQARLGQALAQIIAGAGARLGAAYAWQAALLDGLPPATVAALARRAWAEGLAEPVGAALHTAASAGAAGVARWRQPTGLRPCPQVFALARALHQAGIGLWIVTASHQQVVAAVAADLAAAGALPAAAVEGMRGAAAEPGRPATFRAGKVAVLEAALAGGAPVLTAGDADTDYEMLTHWAPGCLALLINRGLGGDVAALYRRALAAREPDGWLMLQDRDPATGILRPAMGDAGAA